jgi:cyanophycinase-like exopeptidase
MERRTVVAIGGNFSCSSPQAPFGLIPAIYHRARHRRVRVLHLGTASHDSDEKDREVREVLMRYRDRIRSLDSLRLVTGIRLSKTELRERILSADVVFVSSGNTAFALEVWRRAGVDRLLRAAWERGAVLAGSSAGALCWFDQLVTDSYGGATLIDGIGIVRGIACAHYDQFEEGRELLIESLAKSSENGQPGYGISDGSAILFSGETPIGIKVLEASTIVARPDAAGGVLTEDLYNESESTTVLARPA